MKRTLLLALLLIPFLGFSQTTKPIDSFLGIKFGSNALTVKNAITARGGILEIRQSSVDFLVFTNVTLGHRKAEMLAIKFVNKKAYQAGFLFRAPLEPQTIDYYNALVNDLNEVYGKGTSTRNFKSPYEDGDGHELTAIEGGYADFQTLWTNANGNGNAIQAKINADPLLVSLTYQDGALINEAISQQKAKEKSDF